VNLLLDTGVALWVATDAPEIPPDLREALLRPGTIAHVSVLSLAEIADLHAQSPAAMPVTAIQARHAFEACGLRLLALEAKHIGTAGDRVSLIASQARAEGLRLVTTRAPRSWGVAEDVWPVLVQGLCLQVTANGFLPERDDDAIAAQVLDRVGPISIETLHAFPPEGEAMERVVRRMVDIAERTGVDLQAAVQQKMAHSGRRRTRGRCV